MSQESEKETKEDDKAADAQIDCVLSMHTSPWFRFFIDYNPKPALEQVMCPALFLFGELDTQVPAEINRMAIADILQKSGNNDYSLETIPKANHVFQNANTGSPSEYMSLEKEFAFVKDMELYKNHGDFWVRPQHELHIKLFFLQGKLLASEIIKNGGVESIQVSLEKVKSHRNDLYFDEQMLNRIAYVWMDKGHVSEAIEVYKLNADSFPHSFNAQNSLAEAYLRKGDTTNALKSFEKSLELDPENEGVQKALKELSR